MTDWKTTAKINDHERNKHLSSVFTDGVLPIISPLPQMAKLPEVGEGPVYMLDLNAISPEQRQGVVNQIAERFGYSAEFVDAELESVGVPILADGVTVTCADQGLILSMMLDYDMVDDDLDGDYAELMGGGFDDDWF